VDIVKIAGVVLYCVRVVYYYDYFVRFAMLLWCCPGDRHRVRKQVDMAAKYVITTSLTIDAGIHVVALAQNLGTMVGEPSYDALRTFALAPY
jgi:hypothetical protein